MVHPQPLRVDQPRGIDLDPTGDHDVDDGQRRTIPAIAPHRCRGNNTRLEPCIFRVKVGGVIDYVRATYISTRTSR